MDARYFTFLLLICMSVQSCGLSRQQKPPALTQRERQICMMRASSTSGNSEIARQELAKCVKDVREGRLDLNQNEVISPPEPKASSLTPTAQYQYCILHRDAVKESYNLYSGAVSRLAVLERDLGPLNDRTKYVHEQVQNAELRLMDLLPREITGEMNLVPDAARKFSVCDRAEFRQ